MTPLEEQLENLARSYEQMEDPMVWRFGVVEQLRALLPLEVTDEMVEAGAKALGEWGGSAMPGPPLNRELSRACLSAALTQKGDNE